MPFSRATAISLLVAGAFFMENLDGTVIVTAIPQMAKSFGVQPVELSIGVSAYILALAVLIPASGWLADRLGARMVFASAIVIFTLASVLCGLAPNLPLFVVARVLQGVGGAMMVPVGRLVVLKTASKAEIISAIGLIVWPGLAAPVLGPPLGGFITTYFSWHWIFLINVPVGIFALFLGLKVIPASKPHDIPASFDKSGALLIFTGLASLLFAVSEGTTLGWTSPVILGTLALAVITLSYFVLHELRVSDPLLELRLFLEHFHCPGPDLVPVRRDFLIIVVVEGF